MPVHDWTRVDSGIFHAFHLGWIAAIQHALNAGLLPPDYYALAEQHAGQLIPDILTLKGLQTDPRVPETTGPVNGDADHGGGVGLMLEKPRARVSDETDSELYVRKQRSVMIRHVTDDHVVALIEVVSPGNKDGRAAFTEFIDKAV